MRRGEEKKTAKGQKEVETEKRIMQTKRKLGSAGKTRNNESRQMLPFILFFSLTYFCFLLQSGTVSSKARATMKQ